MSLAICLVIPSLGEEKKEEKKPEPPHVTLTVPLAVSAGATNRFTVRGQNLTNATELRFIDGMDNVPGLIRSRGRAEVPKDADAKKAGDTQIEVEWILPADAPAGTNRFVITSPDGVSTPHPLLVIAPGLLAEEREPNGGFKQAHSIESGRIIAGGIREPGDVDVFQVSGRPGQQVRIEIRAAGLGSLLDSVVTLHDSRGRTLVTNDDAASSDSDLRARLPSEGLCFVSVIDAHDRGGPLHGYLLFLERPE